MLFLPLAILGQYNPLIFEDMTRRTEENMPAFKNGFR